jgi:hypothetical protein
MRMADYLSLSISLHLLVFQWVIPVNDAKRPRKNPIFGQVEKLVHFSQINGSILQYLKENLRGKHGIKIMWWVHFHFCFEMKASESLFVIQTASISNTAWIERNCGSF